ncbi:AMP-binding protein [bacterium]|nr:AMP-binding protein [bacterium]
MIKENLVETLEKSILKNWDNPCFSDYGGATCSYGGVAASIVRIHELFKYFGIKKGDKIALCGRNSSNWGIVYLASVTCGAVIVPILVDFSPEEIVHIVNHSDSKLFFAAESVFEKTKKLSLENTEAVVSLENFGFFFVKDEEKKTPAEKNDADFVEKLKQNPLVKENFHLEAVSNDTQASIVYTSGTTGFSKGVMLTHNALMVNVKFFVDNLMKDEPGNVLAFLPLAHCFGCAYDFLSQFARGAHIYFLGKIPTPKVILQAFEEINPVIVVTVPLILEKIYQSKIVPLLEKGLLATLIKIPLLNKVIYSKIGKEINSAFGSNHFELLIGGAAFNPQIEEFFAKCGVRFTVGYGMTECAPLIAYTHYFDGRPVGSCGKVIEYLQAKIDAPDENGVGEICVKGENVFTGYYKMEKETAEAFDGEGWFHTGDLGFIDDKGFLFIKGRIKSMILSASGQNIYPEEIEAKLNTMPYVAESLVIENREHKLSAFVFPDTAKARKDGVTDEQLAEIMEENRVKLNAVSSSFTKISEIKIHPQEFEKTSTKKIKRRLYQNLAD